MKDIKGLQPSMSTKQQNERRKTILVRLRADLHPKVKLLAINRLTTLSKTLDVIVEKGIVLILTETDDKPIG